MILWSHAQLKDGAGGARPAAPASLPLPLTPSILISLTNEAGPRGANTQGMLLLLEDKKQIKRSAACPGKRKHPRDVGEGAQHGFALGKPPLRPCCYCCSLL